MPIVEIEIRKLHSKKLLFFFNGLGYVCTFKLSNYCKQPCSNVVHDATLSRTSVFQLETTKVRIGHRLSWEKALKKKPDGVLCPAEFGFRFG